MTVSPRNSAMFEYTDANEIESPICRYVSSITTNLHFWANSLLLFSIVFLLPEHDGHDR